MLHTNRTINLPDDTNIKFEDSIGLVKWMFTDTWSNMNQMSLGKKIVITINKCRHLELKEACDIFTLILYGIKVWFNEKGNVSLHLPEVLKK